MTKSRAPQKKKILIVDDEPDMVYSLKLTMENAGHETVTAGNGQEALEKISEGRPDLIIADVIMPVMDGFAFYKRLKKSKATSNIPVIILTARGQMEDAFKVVGVDDFIAKPFENEVLLFKVEALLNRAQLVADAGKETKTRVLVAGVYHEVVENIVMQLNEKGCVVDYVLSGPEVISQSAIFNPHLLIMDIQMDGIESDEVIKIMRLLPKFKKIPIILYSYYRLTEIGIEGRERRTAKRIREIEATKEKCIDAGATDYIGKFDESAFIECVGEYL